MDDILVNPSRRAVLKTGAAASLGLVVGFNWGGIGRRAKADVDGSWPLAPNAFVRIAPDDTVTVISKHTEMGQGVYTGVATILADELDADWSRITIETAPVDIKLYKNAALGMQGTGGSLQAKSRSSPAWFTMRAPEEVCRSAYSPTGPHTCRCRPRSRSRIRRISN
jgi:CO/xanthine dehydrogenase Mo-binding subunit